MATVNNNQSVTFRTIESQFIEAFNKEQDRLTWLIEKYPDNKGYHMQIERLSRFLAYYEAVQGELERLASNSFTLIKQLQEAKNSALQEQQLFTEFMASKSLTKDYFQFLFKGIKEGMKGGTRLC
jgi:ABC-type uncharacterized transport system fused permease/ATPase subunit